MIEMKDMIGAEVVEGYGLGGYQFRIYKTLRIGLVLGFMTEKTQDLYPLAKAPRNLHMAMDLFRGRVPDETANLTSIRALVCAKGTLQ